MTDSVGPYVFTDNLEPDHARRRHESAARLWDTGTFAILDRLGVAPGWRCLEIGAGIGSVSRWLAARVGPEGYVLATDVNPIHLTGLDAPNVEVAALDLLRDEMPLATFDLVYARAVVEHTGLVSLERMTFPLRPNGLLLVEELAALHLAAPPSEDRVRMAILAFMTAAGMDPFIGAKVPAALARVGLTHVLAEGRATLFRGGGTDTEFARTTLFALRASLVAAGAITDDECDLALAKLDDPNEFSMGPLMIATCGQRRG